MATMLISFAALVISGFSFFVAWERFRLDLYNKRFDIYVRTIKFYHALVRKNEREAHSVDVLYSDFLLACSEAKFLFRPCSGVYDLLKRLDKAAFEIINFPKLSHTQERRVGLMEAQTLWIKSIGTLEKVMAPYLNFHYAFILVAFVDQARKLWRQVRKRW
jgi:hypothetical protein